MNHRARPSLLTHAQKPGSKPRKYGGQWPQERVATVCENNPLFGENVNYVQEEGDWHHVNCVGCLSGRTS